MVIRPSSAPVEKTQLNSTERTTIVCNSQIRKIAFVGDYLPRKCGIATFTDDLYTSVAGRFRRRSASSFQSTTARKGMTTRRRFGLRSKNRNLESYLRAADFLNFASTDVVCLQHEYGDLRRHSGRPHSRAAPRPANAGREHLAHGPA